jgi:hypothetical protein
MPTQISQSRGDQMLKLDSRNNHTNDRGKAVGEEFEGYGHIHLSAPHNSYKSFQTLADYAENSTNLSVIFALFTFNTSQNVMKIAR